MEDTLSVHLKSGRGKPVRRGHPWVFSGAVERVEGNGKPGDLCVVLDAEGELLGRGWWSPRSQIRVRMLTWSGEPVDADLYRRRIAGAVRLRRETVRDTNAWRVLHGEGDYLPGVIADYYNGWLSISFLSAGADRDRNLIAALLREATEAKGVWERSDPSSRADEGLPQRSAHMLGDMPPPEIEIEESGCRYLVDIREGHKTGFYLDQRDARRVAAFLSPERRVLDAFSYSGGFSAACARAGARSVVAVDESEPALDLARRNVELNEPEGTFTTREGNAFDVLRDLPGEAYDLVILDPPPFAPRASAVKGATRGYKDINMQGIRLTANGGYLLTFSCSHHVDMDLFRKVVYGAAVDVGRPIQVLARLGQPTDHPVDLAHIQGEYLKGLLLRVVG